MAQEVGEGGGELCLVLYQKVNTQYRYGLQHARELPRRELRIRHEERSGPKLTVTGHERSESRRASAGASRHDGGGPCGLKHRSWRRMRKWKMRRRCVRSGRGSGAAG
jgi:hypothetical protein